MGRDEAFALKFVNRDLKIVAADHEVPLSDVCVCVNDDNGRSIEFILLRSDAIKLALAVGVTGEDLVAAKIKG